MKTLSRMAWDQHRVRCDNCGYNATHSEIRDAIADYRDHTCNFGHVCGRDMDPGCDGCFVVAGDSGGEF